MSADAGEMSTAHSNLPSVIQGLGRYRSCSFNVTACALQHSPRFNSFYAAACMQGACPLGSCHLDEWRRRNKRGPWLLRCCKSRLKDDRSYEHDWLDGVDDLMGSWARCLDGIDGLDGAVMVDW